jgi:long-chain acyl-CoA synthetase
MLTMSEWPAEWPAPAAAAFKAHARIGSVADIIDEQLLTYAGRTAVRYDDGTDYRSVSFEEYHGCVVRMIGLLQAERVERRVVATLCKNRLEWDMAALAAFYTGNILFPLDTRLIPAELEHLLALSPPDCFLLSRGQLERFRAVARKLRLRTRVLLADLTETFEDAGAGEVALEPGELGLRAALSRFDPRARVAPSALLDDPETILGHYATSGTTSLPKVVRISHGNIVAEVNCAYDVMNLRPNEDFLNIGPYTHIATLVEFLVSKSCGYTVSYFTREPDEDDVLEDEIAKLRRHGVRIKALAAVPKFWVHLVKEVLEEMKNKPTLRKLYAHLSRIERNGTLQDIGTIEKAKLAAARIQLRNKLGGYFSYGISSSTKLDGAIVRILGKLGITCIDIYGATECTGIIARNELSDVVPGSCGKLVRQLEHRLRDVRRVPGIERAVGVLHLKGPTVAREHIAADGALSRIAGDDGWYATGDLCWVEDDGQVHLVGREKELLRWDDGTLVDPQALSNLLTRSVFVKDALVARRRPEDPFLSVYVLPDRKRLEADAEYRAEVAAGVPPAEALKRRMVDAIAYAESIARITPTLDKEHVYLLPRKLERTPTHKIKFWLELRRLDEAERI